MEKHHVKVEVADPTVLGLFGLAIVTFVAASQKLGITSGYSFLVPWAIMLGGVTQVIASIFDFKHNNLFGATAFSAYGFFWITVALCWLTKLGCFGETLAAAVDPKQLGVVFIGYLILSIVLLISTLKMSKVMFFLLLVICILLFSLALDAFGAGEIWKTVAAYSELATSLLTFYALSAKYLNTFFGKEIVKCGSPIMK